MTDREILLIILASLAVIGFGGSIFLWKRDEDTNLRRRNYHPEKDDKKWDWDEDY